MNRVVFTPLYGTWHGLQDRSIIAFIKQMLPEWSMPFHIVRHKATGGFTVESTSFKMAAILKNRVASEQYTHNYLKKDKMEVEFQPATWERKVIAEPVKKVTPEVVLPKICIPFIILIQECRWTEGEGRVFSYFTAQPECICMQ